MKNWNLKEIFDFSDVSFLNICGGKFYPIDFDKLIFNRAFLLNVDQIYFSQVTPEDVQYDFEEWIKYPVCKIINLNYDIYQFIERFPLTFNFVSIYRFLEHVPKSEVLHFIWLLSTVCKINGYIDVIVPDYKKLAERILNENPYDNNFEAEDIITTYELVNEQPSPHLSIWTSDRLKYFFELEGRFETVKCAKNYEFDGRNLYIRYIAKRIR